MTILHIENRDDVVKNKESNAILANDINAFQHHLNKRKKQQTLENRVTELEKKVAQLEEYLKMTISI